MIQTQSDNTLQVLPCSPTTSIPSVTTSTMITLGFADPSSSMTPGWPLRNLLAWAHYRFKSHSFQVVCYRESPSKSDALDSIVIHTELPLDATFLQQNQMNGK
jgi:ubiquitin-like modifier-activating enzyme ATG7